MSERRMTIAERLIYADLLKKDLDKTIEHIAKKQGGTEEGSFAVGMCLAFKTMIGEQPTIEAKPVVYAHWESTIYTVEKAPGEIRKIVGYRCGNCGRIIEEFENYCPSCGAEMYEKRECLSSV